MNHFIDLAGKIWQLYKANQAEWIQLAEQGFEQEINNKGPISFMPERPLSLPGMVARLTCLCNSVLKSSSPIIEYKDYIDPECSDQKKSIAYHVMLAAVTSDIAHIAQIEAWLDEVEKHFGKNPEEREANEGGINTTQPEIREGWRIENGLVFFDSVNLQFPGGQIVEVMKELIDAIGRTATHTSLEKISTISKIRGDITTIRKLIRDTPYKVKTVTHEGYSLQLNSES